MIFGYLRVSTETQTIKNQREKISTRFKVDKWISDVGTGAKVQKSLQQLIESDSSKGDSIVVTALDRLGRNVKNCSEIAETLAMKGVTLISIREGVDFSTSSGQLAFNVMISMAEFERAATSERIKDGLNRVKSEGKKLGSPKKLPIAKELEIVQSLRYLKLHHGFGLRQSKLIVEKVFTKTMSIGYLHTLNSRFDEDLVGVSYPREELDSGARLIIDRNNEIKNLKNRPLFDKNEHFHDHIH
jgi:DNA invertase Pin-like site-specific DNA recombinase